MSERPAQHQDDQPGHEDRMVPQPDYAPRYAGSDRLKGKTALVTGGDSGIGRACAVLFAREGANVALVYLDEEGDARKTESLIAEEGGRSLLIKGDVVDPGFCRNAVDITAAEFGALDILVNNAAEQHPTDDFESISPEQLRRTFETNFFGYFQMAQAALKVMKSGARIINTASITAYRGSHHLIDYSATKGAIVAFTRSLSQYCSDRNILVNAVAPGPIWTPLIPATFDAEAVAEFGADQPLGRAGQPNEVAASFLFLACADSSYMTGQVLHPNGGEIIGG
tara:strand:+ start:345 stop:1190 length:846 start_codon:yes stop_codon:yes gene_type:complete